MSFQKRAWLLCVAAPVLVLSFTASTPAQNSQITANSLAPRVTGVTGPMELGRVITVDVEHLSDWGTGHDPRKLVPYLNGRALKGLYPEEVDLSRNKLQFHLLRSPDSKQVWADLLSAPVLRRPVSVSVGLEDQSPFETVYDYGHRLSLTVIPKAAGIIALAVILGAVILFVYLVRKTNIIRDPVPGRNSGTYNRYNLGRAQMAFWFFLISISYTCLWLITGDFDTVPPSVLGLVGISAAATLGAHLMRRRRDQADYRGRYSIKTDAASISGLPSTGFLSDILSDANGYTLHRLQMFAWTIVLGIIFVSSVYNHLAMPNFTGGLLAMTGISAGTYLGFNLQERRN